MYEINNNYNPVERIKLYTQAFLKSIEKTALNDCKLAKTTEETKKMEFIYNLLNKPDNTIYMEIVALSNLIKDTYPSKIKAITISDLSKNDINYRSKLYMRILPAMEAIYITGICSKALNFEENKPNEELIEYLKTKGFPEIVTSDELEEFRNLVIKILKRKELNEDFLKDAICVYIIDYTCNDAFEIDFSKSIVKEFGYLSNKKIIEIYRKFKNQIKTLKSSENAKTAEDYVHDFLNMDEVFGKFEQGKITVEERQILRPEDYVYRFLQNHYRKQTNVANILDKVKITALTDMFKSGLINFEDLYILLTAPESRFSKCNIKDKERLKIELRKIYFLKSNDDQKKEISSEKLKFQKRFTSTQLLKLAQIGLVSQIDMLAIYASQRHIRKDLLQKSKSLQLYQDDPDKVLKQYDIITDEEMLEYFDEKNLIDIYIEKKKLNSLNDSRNNKNDGDLKFIFACCYLYMSEEDIETQIITDERIKPEDILFFYEKGIVSDQTIKTLTLNNSEFKAELFNQNSI